LPSTTTESRITSPVRSGADAQFEPETLWGSPEERETVVLVPHVSIDKLPEEEDAAVSPIRVERSFRANRDER